MGYLYRGQFPNPLKKYQATLMDFSSSLADMSTVLSPQFLILLYIAWWTGFWLAADIANAFKTLAALQPIGIFKMSGVDM